MAILITGGAGYIGSHCIKMMAEQNENIIIVDNLSTGYKEAVKSGKLYVGSILDLKLLQKVFEENNIESVIHFAAFSLVGESNAEPYKYYHNNVLGSLNLLQKMAEHNVKRIVFSSTAATYGVPKNTPITEDEPQLPINTYGRTKLAIEQMLASFEQAYGVKYITLRYFNVAGAHYTGEIGESHNPETHIIPNILAVANGKKEKFTIFGNNYKTKDGTCIRDYIHVEDLVTAHISALNYLKKENKSDCFNLGSGGGYSNLEILNAVKKITGIEIISEYAERREGDPDILIASSKKAEETLNWNRRYDTIEKIIESAWKWHQKYPNGYNIN